MGLRVLRQKGLLATLTKIDLIDNGITCFPGTCVLRYVAWNTNHNLFSAVSRENNVNIFLILMVFGEKI